MADSIELAIDALSWVCLTAGSLFCVIGGIGILRLPELYSRTHGASITDTLGAGLVLLGLTLQAGFTLTALKLLLVLAFMLFTGPAAAHALARAAYAHGVKAWVVGEQPADPPAKAPGDTD